MSTHNEKEDSSSEESSTIPLKSMLTLSYVLCVEAMSFTLVIPFCAFLVTEFGDWDTTTAGYVSGSLVASFQVGQIFFAPMWGARSDRFGRKPVLMCGVLAAAVFGLGFGLSANLWTAIIFRFLWGATNANQTVVKTAVLEMLNGKTESKGFSYLGTAWSTGGAIGPLIGGLLYAPCHEDSALSSWSGLSLPTKLSSENLLCRYPALLPCLFITIGAISNLFVIYWVLPETLKEVPEVFSLRALFDSFADPVKDNFVKWCGAANPRAVATKGRISEEEGPSAPTSPTDGKSKKSAVKKLSFSDCMRSSVLRTLLTNYGALAAANVAFSELLPLFAMAPQSHGGLGLDAKHVALIFTIRGVLAIVSNFPFSWIERTFGRLKMWKYSIVVWLVASLFFPVLHSFRQPSTAPGATGESGGGPAYHLSQLGVVLVASILFLAPRTLAVNNAFGLNMLLTGILSPVGAKGTLMAFSVSIAAAGRSLGPIIFAPLFAWSIQYKGVGEGTTSTPTSASSSSSAHSSPRSPVSSSSSTHAFPFNQYFSYLIMSLLLLYPLYTTRNYHEAQLHRPKSTATQSIMMDEEKCGRKYDELWEEEEEE